MQAVAISSAVLLTVALLVLIVYAIRTLNQLTNTIRKLDDTLERSTRTLDSVDLVLASARDRMEDLGRLASTVNTAHDVVMSVGGGFMRRTAGPASSVAGIALAAMKGVEAFLSYRRKSKGDNGHE